MLVYELTKCPTEETIVLRGYDKVRYKTSKNDGIERGSSYRGVSKNGEKF